MLRKLFKSNPHETLVPHWEKGEAVQNLGDFLSEYVHARHMGAPKDGTPETLHLVGSVISDMFINRQKKRGRSIGFWSCGMRDTYCCEKHRDYATYFGVRGSYTAAALNLPKEKIVGDLGLLFPLIYPSKSKQKKGKYVTIPHFHDKRSDLEILNSYGGNSVLRTNVENSYDAVDSFLNELTTASFILTASLHGAILAYAYGIPFALLNSGAIDCPFKWIDFMSTTGMTTHFVQHLDEGLAWAEKNKIPKQYFDVRPLIQSCPFQWKTEIKAQKSHLPVFAS